MYRLLIVDDETYIADGIADLFESSGLPLKEIKRAYSAREALSYFSHIYYDIVIADIRMPETDGLAFCETLRRQWSRVKVIFLTGFADFEYARQAMKLGACDFLLKPADDRELVESVRRRLAELQSEAESMMALHEVQRQAKEALPARQERFIRYLIEFGTQVDENALERELSQSGLPFDAAGDFSLFLLRFDSWERRFQKSDEPLVFFAVQNMLGELTRQDWRCCSFRYQGFIAFVLQWKGKGQANGSSIVVEKFIEHVQDAIYDVLGIIVSLIYSRTTLAMREWGAQLRELATRLRQTPGQGKLLIYDAPEEPLHYGVYHEVLTEILNLMETGDLDGFERKLNQLVAEEGNAASEHPLNLVILFIEISRQLLQMSLRLNISGLLEPQVFEQLSNLNVHSNPVNIKKFFMDVLAKLVAEQRGGEENSSERLVREAKSYIGRHLDQDLSLDAISRSIYVNSSYLSRIFHQVTGELISAYITRKKLDEAKKLLLQPSVKVLEVSGKLGYDNPNYFAKVFRKHVGLSPQEFRMKHLPNIR